MLTNENYKINDNGDMRMLYFRFMKFFIPKFIRWDKAWYNLNDIQLNNETYI